MADEQPPTPAYHQVKFASLMGATAAFDWAGSKAIAVRSVETDVQATWWQAALGLLAQLHTQRPALAGWLTQIGKDTAGTTPEDPLGTGWRALLRAQGLPDYPLRFGTLENGESQWHSACPYDGLAHESFLLTLQWLQWSYEAVRDGKLAVRQSQIAAWQAAFDRLGNAHPSPAEMAFHHDLWRRGVTWQWLDGTRTRIGQGSRQVIAASRAAAPGNLDDPDRWRIPIYTVTGSIGKTSTARMLSQVLTPVTNGLALAASDGAWIGATQVAVSDCIGGRAANALLQEPLVQAAIFEQGRGGFLAQGVPYASSDIGILLNIESVHLGADGVDTLEQMADLKALGIRPAKIAVLNHDDSQCRRIGQQRAATSVVWFSVTASAAELASLSTASHGAIGVERGSDGQPMAISMWRGGTMVRAISLDGVAPFQGMLGEKTVEELLAVVGAGWFGPIALDDNWVDRLRALRLDSHNHLFRTSIHRHGKTVYILDKAGEAASLRSVRVSMDHLAAQEGSDYRIAVFCRSASEPPERHIESARAMYEIADEFICFDRPRTYTLPSALPIYSLGSLPAFLRDELLKVNAERNSDKPVAVAADWAAAQACLVARRARISGHVLVLINQPATAANDVNDEIIAFIRALEAEEAASDQPAP